MINNFIKNNKDVIAFFVIVALNLIFYKCIFSLIHNSIIFVIDYCNYSNGTYGFPLAQKYMGEGIGFDIEKPIENIYISIKFSLLILFFALITWYLPLMIISICWTIYCYRNYAKKYDDQKHQKLLKWLNIFYMPFYFLRMIKKGWLIMEKKE